MGKLDINVGKLKKNAFRYSKVRGETASRIRIPGGVIDADSLAKVVEIAEKYGQGVIDLTNRQGIEIPRFSRLSMHFTSIRANPEKVILLPEHEILKPVPVPDYVLSAATTQQRLHSGWKNTFFRMTATLRSPSQAVPMTVRRPDLPISASLG